MSAPHPRFPDNTPSLKRVLAAFAPPEAKAADAMIERMRAGHSGTDGPMRFEPGVVEKYSMDPTGSEVMSSEARSNYENANDTRPQGATGAAQINLLEELAVILRRITWSQMTEFGTGINADPKHIHDWSNKYG